MTRHYHRMLNNNEGSLYITYFFVLTCGMANLQKAIERI